MNCPCWENQLLVSLHAGLFFMIFCPDFSESTFSKNSFRDTIRVSNSVDPDQAGHFVGPDLGPICLQRLSWEMSLVI